MASSKILEILYFLDKQVMPVRQQRQIFETSPRTNVIHRFFK